MTMQEVVGRLESGMTIGIGGRGARRKPMALVREILRSSLSDLTIVACGGPDVGMLCAAGKVKRLILGFAPDLVSLDTHFRAARRSGTFEVHELDESMLRLGLQAAALRMPFLPARADLAREALKGNSRSDTARLRYDADEPFVAMRALRLDAALLHVTEADTDGNCIVPSLDSFFDDIMGHAADRTFLTCERLVPVNAIHSRRRGMPEKRLGRNAVAGVAEVPFGAHPTAIPPDYGIDMDHLNRYNATADEGWSKYREQFVDLPDHAAYLAAVGGTRRLSFLAVPAG